MSRQSVARRRLLGMIRKESLQIIRDPSSIAIAFIMPVVLLLLFGYGVSLDARHVPIAIVVEQADGQTVSLGAAFSHSEYFSPQYFATIQRAQKAFDAREVFAIVWLKNDFSDHLRRGDSGGIGVIVNGVDANQARISEGYIEGVWQTWLLSYIDQQDLNLSLPLTMQSRLWFNAAVSSRNFLVPGLIAVIMTLIGAMLTAMVVAREWERGTMEALLVTPIRINEIIVGKLLPYFILGMGGMLLSVAMAVGLFGVPLRGSFLLLVATSALFMLVTLGMGLLISIVAKNQFIAGQIAIIVTFLPAFILSGFIFQIDAMPEFIQWLTLLIPARYFVNILQTLFLAGNIWPIILANAAALAVMMLVFLGLARHKMHKRLQ